MAKQPIPAREPISDSIEGAVYDAADAQVLALSALDELSEIVSGTLIVRYGLRFLGKPHLSIVPDMVALDYGDILVGEAAWDFIINRSNRFPRAEVFGFRNDGRDEMMYVKNLDLALPVEVLVYTAAAEHKPVAKPSAIIAPPDAALPTRLAEALPRYDSLTAWRDATTNPSN